MSLPRHRALLVALALFSAACGTSAETVSGSAAPTTAADETSDDLGASSGATETPTTSPDDAESVGVPPTCDERTALFEPFIDQLTVACDDTFLYVDAEGLSTSEMMVGITAWNQQVPLPQPYEGTNAWRIPLDPVVAAAVTPTNGQGAIGVALDGVPIFDPTQQDGVYAQDRDPYLIGELDSCGGHAGRGDDYHYHSGPVCVLDELAEAGGTVGLALDGFPIVGFHEADGATPEDIDGCNGHDHGTLGYHYHLVEAFPYVLGCYSGIVDISIQPRAHPVRSDGSPIQAEITAYTVDAGGTTTLDYLYEGVERSVSWIDEDDGCFRFTYVDPPQGSPGTGTETVCRRR
jgi:hypothetical protein